MRLCKSCCLCPAAVFGVSATLHRHLRPCWTSVGSPHIPAACHWSWCCKLNQQLCHAMPSFPDLGREDPQGKCLPIADPAQGVQMQGLQQLRWAAQTCATST